MKVSTSRYNEYVLIEHNGMTTMIAVSSITAIDKTTNFLTVAAGVHHQWSVSGEARDRAFDALLAARCGENPGWWS